MMLKIHVSPLDGADVASYSRGGDNVRLLPGRAKQLGSYGGIPNFLSTKDSLGPAG